MGDPGTKSETLTLEDLEATSGFRTGRKHILSILVENKPGVLTRVAGLFARRGFNIDTLVVGPTDDPTLSRITLTLDGGDAPDRPGDQAAAQAGQRDQDPRPRAGRDDRPRAGRLQDLRRRRRARRRSCSSSRSSRAASSTSPGARSSSRSSGRPTRSRAFEKLVRPFGLIEMAQTGEIAIARGRGET